MFHNRILAVLSLTVAIASPAWAQPGHASAQPDLSFALPDAFIRAGGLFDGVADFDAATAGP